MYRKSHIKKKRQKKVNFSHKKEYLELSGWFGMVKIGQDGHKLSLSRPHAAIFEILIFHPKPAARNVKNAKNVLFYNIKVETE